MIHRVDAGTDVAMIGAWDQGRDRSANHQKTAKNRRKSLEEDASEGDLFLVYTGGDCGGWIDIYVDETVPVEIRQRTNKVENEVLLKVPTGRLVVGGVEDYRAERRSITSDQSVVTIPEGDYGVTCHVCKDDDEVGAVPELNFDGSVGADDLRYHDKVSRRGLFGYLTLLLFPLLVFPSGWKIALLITVPVFVATMFLLEAFEKRDSRFRRISEEMAKVMRKQTPPLFVFEMRKLPAGASLKGGSVRID